MPEPLLQVNNLKMYFPVRSGIFLRQAGWVKAVDDVSFNIYPGETLGLVGESGCGKSTIGKSIVRLLKPTGGSILFNGPNIATLSQRKCGPCGPTSRWSSRTLRNHSTNGNPSGRSWRNPSSSTEWALRRNAGNGCADCWTA